MERIEPITQIECSPAVPLSKMKGNIEESRLYELMPIPELFTGPKDEPIALVGGGPSLENTIGMLSEYKNIMLCGSVHDYFMDTFYSHTSWMPNVYCIVCDPDPIMAKYLDRVNITTTYLLASQCDFAVFGKLIGAPKKYSWDCAGPDELNRELFDTPEKLIIGGCTVGTRAMGMAIAMGYKKLHLFGYDTCLTNTYKHHAYDFHDPEQETLGNITEIRLEHEKGPKFICAGYMVAQILDFQWMLKNFADRLDIQIFGGGALAYIMERGKELASKHKEDQENGSRS